MNPKNPSESRTESANLLMPQHANAYGNAFGGQIMAWIDNVAAICAFRHARTLCVTASMDALHFISPIKVGEMVILQANVNFAGKTSMEIGVKVTSENPITGEKKHTASSYLTFVAIDEKGHPVEIPALAPESEQEKKWFIEAKKRRELRLNNRR